MNGAELLVSALQNEGVQQIFGVPGEENLDLVEALRRSTIKLVVTRHEQAAAFMAATHGRLTGRAGVCLSTLGPVRSTWQRVPPTLCWEPCPRS
jgi:acetolactate synthase I/II/III large subunit